MKEVLLIKYLDLSVLVVQFFLIVSRLSLDFPLVSFDGPCQLRLQTLHLLLERGLHFEQLLTQDPL